MCLCPGKNYNWKLKTSRSMYLHGILFAIHLVLRARIRGGITPVQVELQAVIGLRQTSSWNLDAAVKDDFNWKRAEEENVE